MAASDFSAFYQRTTMSTDPGAQSVDTVPTPLSPHARPFVHSWRHENQQFHDTSYDEFQGPSFSEPMPHMNSLPYQESTYARSPYSGHDSPHVSMYYPPTMYSYQPLPHPPRLPPAIRSGSYGALPNPSRSGYVDLSARNELTLSRGVPPSLPSPPHTGYPPLSPSAMAYPPSIPPMLRHAMPLNYRTDLPHNSHGAAQTLGGGNSEQPRQFLAPHGRLSQTNEQQHRQQQQHQQTRTEHHLEGHNFDGTGQGLSFSNVQARNSDRSSSPNASARRNYERYSLDMPQSSTSSDAEEAAARAPPSNRVRHNRARESRRFMSQYCDPNVITGRQIHELKATLPKLLASELPNETSPTCDICSKDYSATHVQASEEEEIAVQLPCGHSFGEFCIFQWVCFTTIAVPR